MDDTSTEDKVEDSNKASLVDEGEDTKKEKKRKKSSKKKKKKSKDGKATSRSDDEQSKDSFISEHSREGLI